MRSRTPYEITFSEANLNSVQIDIYIYTGTQDTDKGSILYSLNASALEIDSSTGFPLAVVDLAPFVRDFFRANIEFNNDYNTYTYWISYVSTRTVNAVAQTPDSIRHILADFGYHDQKDGAQFEGGYTGTTTINGVERFERTVINKPRNTGLTIPVPYDVISVGFYKGDKLVYSYQPSGLSATESEDAIQYVTDLTSFQDTYRDYVLRNNGTLEDKKDFYQKRLLNIACNCIDYDKVSIQYLNPEEVDTERGVPLYEDKRVITVRNYNEIYTTYKATFINKAGAFEDLYFVGQDVKKLKTDSTDVKRNTRSNGSYSPNKHQYRALFKNGRRSITLNTGVVDESIYSAIEEMLLSEFVWLTVDGFTQPVNIKTSNVTEQTSDKEGIINYSIDFDYANDVLNNFQ